MKPDRPEVWVEAIARFEETHPTIRIEHTIFPASSSAYHDVLSQTLKNRDPSVDVFLMDVIWPAEFAAAGWVRNLDSWFSPSERARFLPGPIQAGTYRGGIYGVPSRIDAGLLYYRTDLLGTYGFSPPRTWHELVEQAVTIVTREKTAHPGLRGYSGQFKQYEGLICNMLEFVESNNGSFLSPDETSGALRSPRTLEAVNFVRQNLITNLATPAVLTYQESESLAVFVQGKAVFHRNWPYAWALANDPQHSKIAGKVGVAALPQFPHGRRVAALGGWLYGLSAFSRHPEEAWTFIQFMTGRAMQTLFALRASLAPSRMIVWRDPAVLQANPQFRTLFTVFQTAIPRPRSPTYPILSNILQRFFSRALAFPSSDIAQEARRADRRINDLLSLVQ